MMGPSMAVAHGLVPANRGRRAAGLVQCFPAMTKAVRVRGEDGPRQTCACAGAPAAAR